MEERFSLAQLGAALSLDMKTMTPGVTGVVVFFFSFAWWAMR